MELLAQLKALADPTRLRLLHALAGHELNVNELVTVLSMKQSRVSRHLRILTEAGLLAWRKEGLWVYYRLRDDHSATDLVGVVMRHSGQEPQVLEDALRVREALEQRSAGTRRFFDAIAGDWEELKGSLLGTLDLSAVISELIPAGVVVVDIGCGTGELLRSLQGRARQLIGVDSSTRMLSRAAERLGSGADVRLGAAEHLPLRDGEVDAAVMNMTLHHLAEPERGVAEAGRVLRAGGLFVLSELDRHEVEWLRVRHGDRWLGFDRRKLVRLAREALLEPRENRGFDLGRGLRLRVQTFEKSGTQEPGNGGREHGPR